MVRLLRNHEIRGLMEFSEYVDAVERGYHVIGRGHGANFPRENLWASGNEHDRNGGGHLKEGAKASLKFKAALLPAVGGAGVQAYTAGFPSELETYMFLFDTETGELAAIMEVLYYDWLKTAATTAVATKYLAPAESSVVALFGTGRHAITQLHGLCAVRPIERVQAYSRNKQPREAFCRKMSQELGIDVVPVASPEEALAGADVVNTITTSPTPVFDGTQLAERAIHINAMGAHYPWVREVDEYVVLNSRIILDEWEQGFQEQGAILMPIDAGQMEPSDVHGDLGGIVAGTVAGRDETTTWTLFLSGGTGIEDVAVATKIYEVAERKDVGAEFEFNQPYEFEL